ncbi:MAG: O-antigen ligase family protein [Ruthenibacterium sp.]
MTKSHSRNIFLVILLLFPMLQPAYFSYCIPLLAKGYDIAGVVSAATVFCLYFYQLIRKDKRKKVNPALLVLFCFEAWIVVITALNWQFGTSGIDLPLLLYIARNGIYALVFGILTEIFAEDIRALLQGCLFVFEILIYSNFITMVLFPNGLYVSELQALNWVLGFKNSHVVYLLPALCFAMLYRRFETHHYRTNLLIGICYASTIIGHSSTTIIGVTIFTLCLLATWKNRTKLMNMASYCVITVVGFFGIVIFRLQNLLSFFIVDVLHKDLTLTGRTKIWDDSMPLIDEKIWFGHGIRRDGVRAAELGNPEAVHTHNQYLELLYIGGMVLLIIFIILVMLCTVRLMRHRSTWAARVLSAILFAVLIMMFTDVYNCPTIYMLFVLAWQVPNIIAQENVPPPIQSENGKG